MRYAGLWALGLALLLFLAMGALVEGPDTGEPPLPGNPPPMAAAILPAGEMSPQAAQALSHRAADPDRLRAMAGREQGRMPDIRPVCDRNGYPLAEASYVRTVYTICRPEALAG